ncbi:MAG TPA: choice-of-anchor J domain-containing protein [Candidatus Cloacimonas sp.]|nr:choice-of-anchor J domain-containing protein [Candidatus Cloacimonas sp.]
MRTSKLLFLELLLLVSALSAWATVNEYSFSSTTGTFTEITGGTIHGSNTNDNECFLAIPIGFTFNFNEVDYTTISIATNGFIAMGDTVVTSNLAISAPTGTNNIVAGLNRDLKSRDTGSLMSLCSGTAPNRVFTVQWLHYRRAASATANDDFSFQIQLQENGNHICYVYGPFTAVTSVANAAIQVGLRGNSNADFNNRTTSTDWANTNAGTANNNFCSLSATVYPPLGLTFMFTPPFVGEPPTAAQNPIPANNAVNVSIYANLSWAAGGGIIDGYKVYLGTDNPPSNIVNGATQTGTVYNPDDFSYSTVYYWKIVPYNTFGDALNCPVWSFTTYADPTVSSFPWNENFDTVTPPALPIGWLTLNANNDNYTWVTNSELSHSQPNSARIRFNESLAMNDWLILPPMQLTQGTNYKIKFFYRASSNLLPEKLALYWGNAPTVADLTNEIYSNDNIINTTFTPAEVIVTPSSSGVYYFGFKGYSQPDMFFLYLDTVSISVWVEILNPPNNLTASVNGFDVHLAWNAPVESRALLGYKVYRNSALISTTSPDSLFYDDLGLSSGFYSYYVTALYTSGESLPTNTVMADVAPVILPPINLTATVVERDVILNWNNPEGNWITWTNMTTGNAIGTNSSIVFDVAHRWTHEDLIPYLGCSITRMEFIPKYSSCTYTMKIWTGGSATDAGTLVHSQVVPNPVINEWNTVFLTAHIPIPASGELYYGYECNTQGGLPAGADQGPQIEGKGNMIYLQGAWQPLTQIAPDKPYNWSLRAFAQFGAPAKHLTLVNLNPQNNNSFVKNMLLPGNKASANDAKNVTGYKIYRDGALIATLNDEEIISYTDAGLANATYVYNVTSVSPGGESEPAVVEVVVNFQLAEQIFGDGFEDYPDFVTAFVPWNLRDIEQSPTVEITDIDFPGSGEPMSYIVFNPSATTPPLTTVSPHFGAKMLASFSALNPPNNDWVITPRMHLGTDSSVKFYARSFPGSNSLDRFRVGVCTVSAIIIPGFQIVSGVPDVEAPTNWNEYVYDLSQYDGQNVFIGIRCVSNSAIAFLVDDFSVHSDGGYIVDNDDPSAPSFVNDLKGNYPNPFNPETTIRFSTAAKGPVTIDIYNIKGQLVRKLLNTTLEAGNHNIVFDGKDENGKFIASGMYFYKMQTGKFSSIRKMILMK